MRYIPPARPPSFRTVTPPACRKALCCGSNVPSPGQQPVRFPSAPAAVTDEVLVKHFRRCDAFHRRRRELLRVADVHPHETAQLRARVGASADDAALLRRIAFPGNPHAPALDVEFEAMIRALNAVSEDVAGREPDGAMRAGVKEGMRVSRAVSPYDEIFAKGGHGKRPVGRHLARKRERIPVVSQPEFKAMWHVPAPGRPLHRFASDPFAALTGCSCNSQTYYSPTAGGNESAGNINEPSNPPGCAAAGQITIPAPRPSARRGSRRTPFRRSPEALSLVLPPRPLPRWPAPRRRGSPAFRRCSCCGTGRFRGAIEGSPSAKPGCPGPTESCSHPGGRW